ncbi:MAG: cyclic nucleotide-binding domain-containing protein [Spirochaetes bacterium]|nr:cyclic nucleotide-binding domain-containing protein [Spirochaetota bacterium]
MNQIQLNQNLLSEKIRKIMVFQYLDDEEINEIIAVSRILQSEKGELIIKEGNTSPYLYGVISGSIGITIKDNDDKNTFLTTLHEGDVFGEAAMFLNTKRTATATGNDAVLLQIERDNLRKFIKKHSNAGVKILLLIIYNLLNKLRNTNQELAFSNRGSINQEEVNDMMDAYLKD